MWRGKDRGNRTLSVRGTRTRSEAKDCYIVRVSGGTKRRLGLGSFCAVVHEKSVNVGGEGGAPVARRFVVPASVVVGSYRKSHKYHVPDEIAEVDKSLRVALGMSFDVVVGREQQHPECMVKLYPLKTTMRWKARDFLSRIFGRRFVHLRTNAAFPNDMEKSLARMKASNLHILGVDDGDVLRIETVVEKKSEEFHLTSLKMQTFSVLDEDIKQRESLEAAGQYVHYTNPLLALGVSQDIDRIFVDADARECLGLSPLDPVRVRRSVGHAFMKEIVEFGLLFGLSSLAVLQAAQAVAQLSVFSASLVMLACVGLSVVLVGYRIRARIFSPKVNLV